MILGLGIGIALNAILFFAIGFDRSVNVDRYSIYPLLAMAGYMILGGIFGGLAAAMVESKTVPNEGIQLSLRNARFAGLVVGGAIALLTPLYIRGPDIILGGSPMLGVWGTLIFSGIVGLYFGILAALWYGGIDVIYHWILARTLGRSGILPRHLHAFLDHASRLSILQRVGGGYIFVHRLLLEHFAKRGRSLPIPGAAK